MANKVGKLIKQARTDAGMTQEQLARKVKNTSASDISKAERGELRLSQDALKQIAKATRVTQKSLLDAAASSSYKKTSSLSVNSTTSSSSKTSMKLSATEKRLVELYRKADSSTKKEAMDVLKKGEVAGDVSDAVGNLLEGVLDIFTK